ncbi:MAG: hypothetical protein IID51_11405 [Proteobacteria bacterium]|nr:hypothetical protein [Pseudomonadota bacterium]
MGMIDDLLTAINEYPREDVAISVTNFKEPGGHINVGETCSFKVKIENNGQLDMKDVRLHLEGTRYARVTATNIFGFPFGFSGSAITGGQNINSHSNKTFGTFHMRADAATPNEGTENRDLFKIHISSFDADLDHVLRDHSHHAGNPEAAYNRHIHPA